MAELDIPARVERMLRDIDRQREALGENADPKLLKALRREEREILRLFSGK
jgi:hypothetical protein